MNTPSALRLDTQGGTNELAGMLRTILEAPDQLTRMSTAARDLGRTDAVERLADRVIGLAEGA